MASAIKVILLAFVMLLSFEGCCADGVKDAAVGGITDVQAKGVAESHHLWRRGKKHRKNDAADPAKNDINKPDDFGDKGEKNDVVVVGKVGGSSHSQNLIEATIDKEQKNDVEKKARWQQMEKMTKEKRQKVKKRINKKRKPQGITWCVARSNISSQKLQGFLDIACSKVNCAEIQPGGSCYEPKTVLAHASYAIDLYYRNTGDCPNDIAVPAITDPSRGTCHYP